MNLIKELPTSDRPREKLLQWGPHILSNAELLAVVLRTGIHGKSAVLLAEPKLSNVDIRSISSCGPRASRIISTSARPPPDV